MPKQKHEQHTTETAQKLEDNPVWKAFTLGLGAHDEIIGKLAPETLQILSIPSKAATFVESYNAAVLNNDPNPFRTASLRTGIRVGMAAACPVVANVAAVGGAIGQPLQNLAEKGIEISQAKMAEAQSVEQFWTHAEAMGDFQIIKKTGEALSGVSDVWNGAENCLVDNLGKGIDILQKPMPTVMSDKTPNIIVNDTHLSLSATDRSTPGNNSQTINQLIDPWDYNLATSNSKNHNINQQIDSLDSNYTTSSDKLSNQGQFSASPVEKNTTNSAHKYNLRPRKNNSIYSSSKPTEQPVVENEGGTGEILIKISEPIQKNQSTSSKNTFLIESDPRTGTTSFKTNTATQGNGGANIVLELTPHVITVGVGGALDTATLTTIATTGATVGTVAVVTGATYLGAKVIYANSKYPSEKITPLSENVIETNIQEIQENHGVTISDETKEKVAELFQKENIHKTNAKNNHNRAKRHKHKNIIGKISKTGGKITGNKKLKELGERYSSKNVKENLANEKMEIDLAAESKNEIIHMVENEKPQLQSIQEDKNVEKNTDSSSQIPTIENSVNNSNNQKLPNEPNENETGSQEYQKDENNNLHVGDKRHRDIEHDFLKNDTVDKKIKNDISVLKERYATEKSQKYVRARFFHKANSIVENEKIPNEIAKTLAENTLNNNVVNNNLNMQVQQTFFNEVKRVDIDDPDILRAATPIAAVGAGVYLGNAIAPDDKLNNLIDQNLSKAESVTGVVGQVTGMAVGGTVGGVAGGMAGAGIGTGIAVGVGFGVASVFGVAAAPVVAPALLLFGVAGVIGGGKWGMTGGMVAGGNIGGKIGDTTSSTISSYWNSLPSLW